MAKPKRVSPKQCKVGEFYFVPCVAAYYIDDHLEEATEWIPVLLPAHDDSELIADNRPHWHYDWRFVDWPFVPTDFGKVLFESQTRCIVRYRRLQCIRIMPHEYPHELANWFVPLQERFKNACMKQNVCPHRGIDLSGCTPINGVITCPAHGLMWEAVTGRAVVANTATFNQQGDRL